MRSLPGHKTRQAQIAAGADYHVRIRLAIGIQIRCDVFDRYRACELLERSAGFRFLAQP